MTSKKILVVEDDPSVRALLVSYLKEFGRVVDVADAEAAIRALSSEIPDLVCVDLSLPEASGFEVCRALQQLPSARNTRVMVASGRSTVTDRALARELGANAFIEKPFRRATIVRTARELLARPHTFVVPAPASVALPVVLANAVPWPAPRSGVSDTTGGTIRNNEGFTDGSDSNSMVAQLGANEVARD